MKNNIFNYINLGDTLMIEEINTNYDITSTETQLVKKTYTINPYGWASWLEQKMLKKMIEYGKNNHRMPTYFIMNPHDTHELKKIAPEYKMGYSGFWKYRDFFVINSYDVVEGEILCL